MLGRIPGFTCGHRNVDILGSNPPPRTPGPTGHTDAADPNLGGAVADSPGPLGHDDHGERIAREYPRWIANRRPELPPERETPPMDAGKLGEQLRLKTGTPHTTVHEDVIKAVEAARQLVRNFDELPEEKKRAVVDMVYTVGSVELRRQTELIQALEGKDFDRAASLMEQSIWFTQAGRRAQEVVALMRQKPPAKPPELPPRLPRVKRDGANAVVFHPPRPRHGFGAVEVTRRWELTAKKSLLDKKPME
jgi:hypothetical protein